MENYYSKQPKVTVESYDTPTLRNNTSNTNNNKLELETSFGN